MLTNSAIPTSTKEMFKGLEHGIQAIIRISTAVKDNNKPLCAIRRNVLDATKHFGQTAKVAKCAVRSVDANYENLLSKKGALEEQQKKEMADLKNQEIELKSNESLLEKNKELLPDYQRRVGVAEEQVKNQKAKMDKAEIMAGVGVGLMVIPVFGWIAGGVMIGVGLTDYEEAVKTRDQAQTKFKEFEDYVKKLKEKIQVHKRSIDIKTCAIRSTKEKIEQVEQSINRIKEQCVSISDFQHKLRGAAHFVDTLAGKARVTEVHTRRFIQLKTLMAILESMIGLIKNIPGIEFIQGVRVNRLVDEMSTNFTNLKALTDKSHRDESSSSQLESWY